MSYRSGSCDRCRRTGRVVMLVRFVRPRRCEEVPMPCPACGGRGSITAERALAMNAGERLRQDRIARGLPLRQEAQRLGITERELADREAGR